MLITVAFGTANTGLAVYYQLLNADKTVAQARAATGVTELVASSGTYGVDVAKATLAGKTVVWDIDGTAKTAAETFDALADLYAIDGAATAGNNATLNLKKLNIVNSDGDAIVAGSSGSNGRGLYAYGNGSGAGVLATGGATAGKGISGVAGAGGIGIHALGSGSNAGMYAQGGSAGDGIKAIGGSTSGTGIMATVGAGNDGDGILAVGAGAGHADINGDILGNLTGNVSGSVGSAPDSPGVTTLLTRITTALTPTNIAEAVRDLATYGLLALNALLVTTGIKVATNADKTGYSGTATNMVAAPDNASAQAAAASAASADGKLTASRLGKLDSLTFTEPLKVDASATVSAAGLATEAKQDAAQVDIDAIIVTLAGDVPAGYTRVTSTTYGLLDAGTVIDAYDFTDTDYATALVPNVTVASNGTWAIDLPDAGHYTLVARLVGKNTVTQEVTT